MKDHHSPPNPEKPSKPVFPFNEMLRDMIEVNKSIEIEQTDRSRQNERLASYHHDPIGYQKYHSYNSKV